jgi:hypothetical protein
MTVSATTFYCMFAKNEAAFTVPYRITKKKNSVVAIMPIPNAVDS